MALAVTADNVRNKLISVTSIKLSDIKLESAGIIPFGTARMNKILTLNSAVYDDLGADDKALFLGASIAFCASLSVATYPVGDWTDGPVQYKGIKAEQKKEIIEMLKNEYRSALSILNYKTIQLKARCIGGSQYMPDSSDLTNISLSDTETSFSLWS